MPRLFVPSVSAMILSGLLLSRAQTLPTQPPTNYNGPDTYGMCAYVIGDTEYISRTFYTSSYFKAKAEADVRTYAQSQANGTSVRSRCLWSFREATLATARETDQRLVGLPSHPAKVVESGWTFQGSALNRAGGATAGSSSTTNGTAAGSQTSAVNRSSGAARNPGNSTTAASGTGATTSLGTGTSGSASTASTGSPAGSAQQSISDAKNNAVSTAASGVSTATTSAVGALSSGMQNMFRRKQAQPQSGNTPAGAAPQGQMQSAAAENSPAEGFGFAASGDPGSPNFAAAAPATSAATHAAESVIADVSGKDLILNQGAQAGLREGMIMTVLHPQRTVNDPASGKPLRTIEATIGELKILSVDATSASAIFSGPGVPVVGDKARLKP